MLKWCPGCYNLSSCPHCSLNLLRGKQQSHSFPAPVTAQYTLKHPEEKFQRRNWFSTLGCYSKGLSSTVWELSGNLRQIWRNLRVQSFDVSTWLVLSCILVPVYIKHPQYGCNLSCVPSLAGGPIQIRHWRQELELLLESGMRTMQKYPLLIHLSSCQLQGRNLEEEQSVSVYHQKAAPNTLLCHSRLCEKHQAC